jgi:F-type H+-transporting ATPase subunit delta
VAESITIARPYTKAVFETALIQGNLSSWSEFLNLAAAVVTDADMKAALDNPALANAKKAQLVIDVCNASQAVSDQMQNFVNLLAENKRLSLLLEVANLFAILKADQEKSIEVSITSAFELGNEQQDKLVQALTAKLSRDVTVNANTDTSLIGGVIIHAGDLVVDGSIRGKLGKLAEALNA